ncbi:MAG: MotA/TolQ/ExbB proton channel family protein [Planctomycetaceae bacterium]
MFEMLQSSGLMGYGLGALAALAIVLIVERFVVYKSESTNMEQFSKDFGAALSEAVDSGDYDIARRACLVKSDTLEAGDNDHRIPPCKGNIAEVHFMALRHIEEDGPATLRNILNHHIDLVILPRLRARLRALTAIGKGAPMVGLLGTVWGMMNAFVTIAGVEGGGVDPKLLARDIGLALGTTFLGLFVAIPVVFATAWFRARVERFEIDLDKNSDYVLDKLFSSQPRTISPSTAESP